MSVPVDAVVVNWNGVRFLPRCLDALARSTLPLRVTVVDNGSTDGSAAYVRERHPGVRLVDLGENRGYAGGANAGIAAARGRYVMILNPDVALAEDHAAILVDRLERDPGVGAAQGRLYGVTPEAFVAGESPRERIDSMGHVIRRTRMVYDRGQGEPAPGPGEGEGEASVFSVTGAAMMLRGSMLDALPGAAPFDPAFFAYKEDIDLCWRARWQGWDVRYVPAAEGWHVRGMPGPGGRSSVPAPVRRRSWINHWLLMAKNDRLRDLLRDLPWVATWELLRLGHALLRDPALLPAYLQVWGHLPHALEERKRIRSGAGAAGRSPLGPWLRTPTRAVAAPGDQDSNGVQERRG